ncbi:sugar-transfer associated ATP-grasp domain-containing protein [Vibrio alfacsensis]|uniref:sugar-transfer associated ATP-grasp domain-containing protein n=1 Tax=Vibrio alfacsensis TaxID=1074311 RepID=UPI002ADDFDD2|nr:sugar-transfer associated ATP-grasp domain-containing protein [Vibrio alfacsensis]WQE78095.1 sugar-transfer associated ATP-grasp domain-containing protein [Vibrio alfacsensis]
MNLKNLKHVSLDHVRFCYHAIVNESMRNNLKRFIISKDKKENSIIRRERKELRDYWGCIPTQYYTHDFYSTNYNFMDSDIKKYIPSYYFYKIIVPQYDNVREVIPIVEHKIRMVQYFREIELNHSNVIIAKKKNELFTINNEKLSQESIIDIINSLSCEKIFIKPALGRGGKGIIIAKKNQNGYEFDGKIINYNYLLSLKGDYVIETEIVQHPYIAKVYHNCINTVRAITVRHDDGNVEIIAATLRMGVAGKELDNASLGGIVIGINLSTGKCLRPFATYETGTEKFYHHPDSGFDFSLLQLPNWEKIKEEIIDSAKKLTLLNLVGWDIAVKESGIEIIEANTLFGIDLMQASVGGMRDFFLKGDPKIHHNIYNYKGK